MLERIRRRWRRFKLNRNRRWSRLDIRTAIVQDMQRHGSALGIHYTVRLSDVDAWIVTWTYNYLHYGHPIPTMVVDRVLPALEDYDA